MDFYSFGQGLFSAKLRLSNEKLFRYDIIWEKTSPTGHLNAKKMPLRSHEDINIFYKNLPIYNPQKTTGHTRKVSTAVHKRNSKQTTNYGKHGLTSYDSTERYPKSIWTFKAAKYTNPKIHSTQKPTELLKYAIKTYTNENMLILDNVSGSGSTGVAAIQTRRKFILIEKENKFFNSSRKWIEETLAKCY